MIRLIPLGLALLLAGPAVAQRPDCDNPMTQADINLCAALDFEAADRALNETWARVRAEIQSRDAQMDEVWRGWPAALLAAQRAWLTFRDTECESQGFAFRGGSMEPVIVSACKADMTNERIRQLLTLVEEN